MSFLKPLCVICERPTADGAVQAVCVDKEKLQTWFVDVCGNEFAEEIRDTDLICYFCIWQAEFLVVHGIENESSAWWPQDLDYLDVTAKNLRAKFFEGKAEQCWVQLEQIESTASEDEEEEQECKKQGRKRKTRGLTCCYCGKVFRKNFLYPHMNRKHKNEIIRCDKYHCRTYFRTVEEKEKHFEEFHDKSEERKTHPCSFCTKKFKRVSVLRQHMSNVHTDFPVPCATNGCLSYFAKKTDMEAHFASVHRETERAKGFKCALCPYKTTKKCTLGRHIALKHLPKTIKCGKCDKMFSVPAVLRAHVRIAHTFKVCSICCSDVVESRMSVHLKKMHCKRCEKTFECVGLFQSHKKSCSETRFYCDECPMGFNKRSILGYHKADHHSKMAAVQPYMDPKFDCKVCQKPHISEATLKLHMYSHREAKFKYCALCPKFFSFRSVMKNHLAVAHGLFKRKFQCSVCKKQFPSRDLLASHKKEHVTKKQECRVCAKLITVDHMKFHLIRTHGVTPVSSNS